MSHSSIRVKPGDHVRLRVLAEKRGMTIKDLLDRLTTAAEQGEIYRPLSGRIRTNGTKNIAATFEQRDRINALAEDWGVYVHQVVSWLLDHAAAVKPQSPHDIWRDMVALKRNYKQMIAEGVTA